MKKKISALFISFAIIISLTGISAAYADTAYDKSVGYSIGLLAAGSYEGYSYTDNMNYADAGAFTAKQRNALPNNGTLTFNQAGPLVFTRQSGAGSDGNLMFGLPDTDSNGVELPADNGVSGTRVLYTVMDIESSNVASSYYIRVPADDTANIRIGNPSGSIGFEYDAAGTGSGAITYNNISGFAANARYELKLLQDLTSARNTTREWSWVRNASNASNSFQLALNNNGPRYGRGFDGTKENQIKVIATKAANTYSLTIHRLKVYEADEYDLQSAVKNTESIFLGGNTDISNISSDLTLPVSYSVNPETEGLANRNAEITWSSSDGDLIDVTDGTVTRPSGHDAEVTLTAEYTLNGHTKTISYTLTLPDGSKEDAAVTPQSAAYDKFADSAAHNNVNVSFSAGDWELSAVTKNGAGLTENVDYSVSGGNFTFPVSYLDTLPLGQNDIVFEMSGGVYPVLTVNVTDSTPKTKFYSGLTAVQDIAAKTVTLTGGGVNDVINMRDIRDNYFYKLVTSNDYSKINSRGRAGSPPIVINPASFYNAFDGFTNAAGALNLQRAVTSGSEADQKVSRVPAFVAFDLGSEKNWNEILLQFNGDGNAQKISGWELMASNDPDAFADVGLNAATLANTVPHPGWTSLYASKAGDELGGQSGIYSAKIELANVTRSRYVMLYIKELSSNNNATFNASITAAACYLRDVESESRRIDYSNKIIEVDGLGDVDAAGLLSNVTAGGYSLKTGIFMGADAVTPVSGAVAENNYLVSYYDSQGTKEIVGAYAIRRVLPRVKGVYISTPNGSDVDNTINVSYAYIDGNFLTPANDASEIQWKRNGVNISGAVGNSYTLTTLDVAKDITAAVTPKTADGDIGISVTSQEKSAEYSAVSGGNILKGLNINGITVNVKNGSGADVNLGGWTAANVKTMLDGGAQVIRATSGENAATVGTVSFRVKLNQARYVNTVNISFVGTDWNGYDINGYLKNGYAKDVNGNDVKAPLFTQTLPAKGALTDLSQASCQLALVDELEFTGRRGDLRYTNGIVTFEAFSDVDDATAVALDGKILETLPAFNNINDNIDLSAYKKGAMYSNITWDFGADGGIDADGALVYDGVTGSGSGTAVCSRGNVTGTPVPFTYTVLNTNLFKLEDFALNANGVEITDLAALAQAPSDTQITLTGKIIRTIKGTHGMKLFVAAYDGNRLSYFATADINAPDANYSKNLGTSGELLQNGNITSFKILAWDMDTLIPFEVN